MNKSNDLIHLSFSNCSFEDRVAQKDIQYLLEKATGLPVAFQVNTSDLKNIRYKFQFETKQLSKDPWEEVFELSIETETVTIRGNNRLSLQSGMYYYLEKLGFRFFLPGKNWTYIPTLDNLILSSISPSKIQPKLKHREVFSGFGFGLPKGIDLPDNPYEEWKNWVRRIRLNSYKLSIGGHYGVKFNKKYQSVLKSDSQFRAEKNGKRIKFSQRIKLCTTNEENINLYAKDAAQRATENKINKVPYGNYINIDPTDKGGFCDCNKCSELGNISNRVFHFANQVAIKAKKLYPNIFITHFAYAQYAEPPSFPLEDNIVIYATIDDFNRVKSPLGLLNDWKKFPEFKGIRTYWGKVYAHSEKDFREIESIINLSLNSGISGIKEESSFGGINNGILQYLIAKKLWGERTSFESSIDEMSGKMFPNSKKEGALLLSAIISAPDLDTDIPLIKSLLERVSKNVKKLDETLRVEELKEYLIYLDSYRVYKNSKEKEAIAEGFMDVTWNIKGNNTVNKIGLAKYLNRNVYKRTTLWKYGKILNQKSNSFENLIPKINLSAQYSEIKIMNAETVDAIMDRSSVGSKSVNQRRISVPISPVTEPVILKFRKKLNAQIFINQSSGSFILSILKIHPTLKETLLNITVFDTKDKVVFEKKMKKRFAGRIDLRHLPEGIYRLEIDAYFSQIELKYTAETALLFTSPILTAITPKAQSFYIDLSSRKNKVIVKVPADTPIFDVFSSDERIGSVRNTNKKPEIKTINIKVETPSNILKLKTRRANFELMNIPHRVGGFAHHPEVFR